jgi:HSP20 family protein
MALAVNDPFRLMNQFHREVNRVFDARSVSRRAQSADIVKGEWVPPVDIQEEAGQYIINADLPGVDSKDIEVTMEKEILTLRGTRTIQNGKQNDIFSCRERPTGSFYRRFVLPKTADTEHITAQGKNGVLQVIIPKRQKVEARRINVEG